MEAAHDHRHAAPPELGGDQDGVDFPLLDERRNGAEIIKEAKKPGYRYGQTHQSVIAWRQ